MYIVHSSSIDNDFQVETQHKSIPNTFPFIPKLDSNLQFHQETLWKRISSLLFFCWEILRRGLIWQVVVSSNKEDIGPFHSNLYPLWKSTSFPMSLVDQVFLTWDLNHYAKGTIFYTKFWIQMRSKLDSLVKNKLKLSISAFDVKFNWKSHITSRHIT